MTLTDGIDRTARYGVAFTLLVMSWSWVWLLFGAGTGMSIWSMSSWNLPPFGDKVTGTETSWGIGHTGLMFLMWATMMWAMMLPRVLLDAWFRERTKFLSTTQAIQYMFVWLLFSIPATALQYLATVNAWLDGMHMWSLDRGFSTSLVIVAGLSQLARVAVIRFAKSHPAENPKSGCGYGLECLLSTGPMMLLLFVGGLMNLVWLIGLTAWAVSEKRWSKSMWHAVASAMICLCIAILIWS